MVSETLVGLKVVSVRKMSKRELNAEGWEDYHDSAFLIQFDNGTLVYASKDLEGNGPGMLFGVTRGGENFFVTPEENI